MVCTTILYQPNQQTPGLSIIPSYQNFDMLEMWLNSMFEIILGMKIKYDDSRNEKKCDGKIFNCRFLFNRKSQLLTFIDIISVWKWLN